MRGGRIDDHDDDNNIVFDCQDDRNRVFINNDLKRDAGGGAAIEVAVIE